MSSNEPSQEPSKVSSDQPSLFASMDSSQEPSTTSSGQPTMFPSSDPSDKPSHQPTTSIKPSAKPSHIPIGAPTASPTPTPTGSPTPAPVSCSDGVGTFTLDIGVVQTCDWLSINQNNKTITIPKENCYGRPQVTTLRKSTGGLCTCQDDLTYTWTRFTGTVSGSCA